MLGLKSVGQQGGSSLLTAPEGYCCLVRRYMELNYLAHGYKRITAPVTLMVVTR